MFANRASVLTESALPATLALTRVGCLSLLLLLRAPLRAALARTFGLFVPRP